MCSEFPIDPIVARHAALVATEVDQPIVLHVATATVTRGNLALIVAAALLVLADAKPLRRTGTRRELSKVRNARAAATGTRRVVAADTHGIVSCSRSAVLQARTG